jgi:hypothetical protein
VDCGTSVLRPAFSPTVFAYTAFLARAESHLALTVAPADTRDMISINGLNYSALNLMLGGPGYQETLPIVVGAHGQSSQSYTLKINKQN